MTHFWKDIRSQLVYSYTRLVQKAYEDAKASGTFGNLCHFGCLAWLRSNDRVFSRAQHP